MHVSNTKLACNITTLFYIKTVYLFYLGYNKLINTYFITNIFFRSFNKSSSIIDHKNLKPMLNVKTTILILIKISYSRFSKNMYNILNAQYTYIYIHFDHVLK